jgi:hypothetical protein
MTDAALAFVVKQPLKRAPTQQLSREAVCQCDKQTSMVEHELSVGLIIVLGFAEES